MGFDIPQIEESHINTRYFELITPGFGRFKYRTFGALGGGSGYVAIPETGQAIADGKPREPVEVEAELYMADADTFARTRQWLKAKELRIPGYKQTATMSYKVEGDEGESMDFPIPEIFPNTWDGPAANQAEPEAGRFTVMFVVANCQLPVI
jgi:hypothetical protein